MPGRICRSRCSVFSLLAPAFSARSACRRAPNAAFSSSARDGKRLAVVSRKISGNIALFHGLTPIFYPQNDAVLYFTVSDIGSDRTACRGTASCSLPMRSRSDAPPRLTAMPSCASCFRLEPRSIPRESVSRDRAVTSSTFLPSVQAPARPDRPRRFPRKRPSGPGSARSFRPPRSWRGRRRRSFRGSSRT